MIDLNVKVLYKSPQCRGVLLPDTPSGWGCRLIFPAAEPVNGPAVLSCESGGKKESL